MNTSEGDKKLLAGHRARLRARLEREPLSVADYEVMELLLGLAIMRRDTKMLAHALLDRFKTIRGVLDARPDELRQIPGFGSGLLSLWKLMREILARYEASPATLKEELSSPQAVAGMARSRLAGLSGEESWIALVDARNRLLLWDRLQKGSISSISIHPRDVLEVALVNRASGIILVHNHPGGNPQPSHADINFTRELEQLAPRLGLRLLDHIIVTAGDCYSILDGRIIR